MDFLAAWQLLAAATSSSAEEQKAESVLDFNPDTPLFQWFVEGWFCQPQPFKVIKNIFKKNDRIVVRSDFERIKSSGIKAQDRHLFAVFLPSQTGRTRIGITVTKRVGNSVTRNRIKRYVREFYRQNRQLLRGVWDINFIARHSAAEAAHEDINACLMRICRKISDNYAG